MKYTVEKKENGIFDATISVSKKEWDAALDTAYKQTKDKFNIPGFRKGKAPRNVIEKAYGPNVFVDNAIDEVFTTIYPQILKEHPEIKPIDAPRLDITKMDDTGFGISLSIACVPEFELGQYKGLTINKRKVKIDDKQVEEAINKELLRASRLVETQKPVKMDDYVTLDFDGYMNGKRFDGGQASNYQLKIGSHSFIDTFEEQLIGLNVGDKKDVVVTFPADYHAEHLANKPATFKVEIKNIRERSMPKLDDEFVSNSTEYETLEQYRASVLERLKKEAQDKADLDADDDLLNTIVDNTDFTPPMVIVEQELEEKIKRLEAQLKYQGIKLEDYVNYMGRTKSEYLSDLRNSSYRNVKTRLILDKIIDVEKIELTEKDVEDRFEENAKLAGITLEEYKKTLTHEIINRFANEILMGRLLDFLHANNTVK